jgi:hypothetical protein
VEKIGFNLNSGNKKTGPIPVSTSPSSTCPSTCPLLGDGCYGRDFHLGMYWDKVDRGDNIPSVIPWDEFLRQVGNLRPKQLWRHNQAGDLPGKDVTIDATYLQDLTTANKGKRGYTYTHKPVEYGVAPIRTVQANRRAIKAATKGGFTINLSANSLAHADRLASLRLAPVVCIVTEDTPKAFVTPEGRRGIVCPQQTSGIPCSDCGYCAKAQRECIVGFIAHGVGKKKVLKMLTVL